MVRRHRQHRSVIRIHRNDTDILRTVLRRAVVLIGSVFLIKFLNILFDNLLNIHIQSRLQGVAILRGNRFLLILLILIQIAKYPPGRTA